MKFNLRKYMNRIMITVQVCALLTALTGLSSCKKTSDTENSNDEAILEQAGDLEIQIPEGEDTFGE